MHQEKNEERDMAFLKLTLDFGCRKKGKKNKMFPLTLFFCLLERGQDSQCG